MEFFVDLRLRGKFSLVLGEIAKHFRKLHRACVCRISRSNSMSGTTVRAARKSGLEKAVNCAVEKMEERVMLAGATLTPHVPAWLEQGPGTITGANTGSKIPAAGVLANPAVGAIQAVATLPSSADVIYVASV